MNIATSPTERESHGYVLEVPYTWSYFEYQSPLRLSYVARRNGFVAPDPSQPFTHCDLGCGNGVTSNLLATVYPHAEFYGVDFNAEHIDNANEMARQAGLENVTFLDASFGEMDRFELPQFDYITLHGVYSWVGAGVRAQVDAVIDRYLKPGGLVYLCYNTLPGASSLVPLWKMMQTYSATIEGDVVTKARGALRAIDEMRGNDARFFRDHPIADAFVDKLKKRDARYLVHEFSNGCYEPQYFSDVAATLGTMGLEFAGSAQLYRNNERNFISSRHFAHLDQAQDRTDRETRGSYARNESFRWDVFIRAAQDGSHVGVGSGVMAPYFGAVRPMSKRRRNAEAGRRKVDLSRGLLADIMELAGPGTLSAGALERHAKLRKYDAREIAEGIDDLVDAECLRPLMAPYAQVEGSSETIYRFADKINLCLVEARLKAERKTYVCSSITGSAIRLDFMNSLFAWCVHDRPLVDVMTAVAARLMEFGAPEEADFKSMEDIASREWLEARARRFFDEYLPRLVQLGILIPEPA